MSAIPPDLEELRRRLDAIDDRLHDLLIERADIVAMVAASKRNGNLASYQPGREAAIIRRLAARRPGRFPLATLVRMWRELLSATVRQQAPFTVAVCAPDAMPGLWDLARDHYGSSTPMRVHDAASQVLRAVGAGEAALGVLPMPTLDDPDPWWPQLLSGIQAEDGKAPQVVARLPFGPRGNARDDGTDALVIGAIAPPEIGLETGADRTLFALESVAEIDRARLIAMLAEWHFAGALLALHAEAGGSLALIEADGFVPAQDPRLGDLAALLDDAPHRLVPLGGYAAPLAAAAKG
jgi:chorismate mutase/prephenate dehydratase